MMMTRNNSSFTMMEMIMVIIILGLLSALAVPRYLDIVRTSEAAAEDAVMAQIFAGLETFATERLISIGRRSWPDNPFDALRVKPDKYSSGAGVNADEDSEWSFNSTTSKITHQRKDNTRWHWDYDKGDQTGDDATVGTLGSRVSGVGGE